MPVDFKKEMKSLDHAIRNGQVQTVRAALRRITRARVPREYFAPIAQLAERCGIPQMGIRMLLKVVRPNRKGPVVATPVEKAEYAVCLAKIGACEESIEILDEIDEKVPRALLYRAVALAPQWKYGDTIPFLKRYLDNPKLDAYQRLVGEVNLAAALVFERKLTPATSLLRRLVHETSVHKHPLLHANSLELSAEHFLLLGRFEDAQKLLERAEGLLKESGTVYEFLIRKWRMVNAYMSHQIDSLDELRALAKEKKHWSTFRDCDRFTLLRTKDRALALHLYFGTPWDSYRARVLTELGEPLDIPPHYEWKIGGNGKSRATLDLFSGEALYDGKITGTLKTGQMLHRLLCVLSSDFYRPFRLAALHSRLHPGDYYHPETTPKKMHQAMMELREWLREAKLPADVVEEDKTYALCATEPMVIRLTTEEKLGKAKAKEIDLLRSRYEAKPFSTAEVQTCLSLPRRTIQRLLQDWVESGILVRSGSGGYTRYQFGVSKN